jgi:hypothetical protein
VSVGTPVLTVTFAESPWWLQVGRADGEGYLDFAPLHEREVGSLELERLVKDSLDGLVWIPLRSPPGLPAAVEAEIPPYRISLHGSRGAAPPPSGDDLVAAFEAWRRRSGRRLA